MTVYSIDYMKKNPATKRQVKVTKYRGQLKFGGKTYSKLFDYESAAESWVKAKYEELSGLAGIGKWIDEIKQITMADLLKEHFKQRLAAQSPSSYKTNQNRCLRAIPAVRIPYQLISKRIDKYKFTNEFAELFFKEFYNTTPTNYVKEGIPFGEFTVESVDM